MLKFTRRSAIASVAALGLVATAIPAMADGHKMTFTLATSGSETDQRSVAMAFMGHASVTWGCGSRMLSRQYAER